VAGLARVGSRPLALMHRQLIQLLLSNQQRGQRFPPEWFKRR
jgi:hypothetical protein